MMKQHGGEGKSAYNSKSSDMSLKQHGGEGKMMGKKSDMKLTPSVNPDMSYCGPGRHLKTMSS